MQDCLSTSEIIAWRQCPKRLWLERHQPAMAARGGADQVRSVEDKAVGAIARKRYRDGSLVQDGDPHAPEKTAELLALHPRRPVFRATFERDGVSARADILVPEEGGYRVVAVQSSTAAEKWHLEECAILAWAVLGKHAVTDVELACVDKEFVYAGDSDYRGLLKTVSVMSRIELLMDEVQDWAEGARAVLAGGEPLRSIGRQCEWPVPCPFQAYCEESAPEADYPLSCLPGLPDAKRRELEAMRVCDIRDIPRDFPLDPSQGWIVSLTRIGMAMRDPAVASVLAALPYPRYFMSFEVIRVAVPRWAGVHPYEAVPVRWSCHVEPRASEAWHRSYLAEGDEDFRDAFASELIACLGTAGPILVYDDRFESGMLEDLGYLQPRHEAALSAIAERVIDLKPVVRQHYYHPEMRGSWSLAAVLPTIAPELVRETMLVGNRTEAQSAWLEVFSGDTPGERRAALYAALAAYGAAETWALVRLAWFLQGIHGFEHPALS